MKIITIIQSRMGSSRFPGKSFYTFNGKPVLEHLIDSVLQTVDKERIVVATSKSNNNAPIVSFCEAKGIACFRGDEENVASRFLNISQNADADFFIRLNGDSPLFDYRAIDEGLRVLKEGKYQDDLVTSMSSDYPSGMNLEIVNSRTFENQFDSFNEPGHFEHVTTFFKEHSEKFRIYFLKCPVKDVSRYKFAFDTEEDRIRINAIFKHMDKAHYYYDLAEKCELYLKTQDA